MEITKISEQDGLMIAHLLQFLAASNRLMDALKLAGMPVSGPGMGRREEASKWLGKLAEDMARQLKLPSNNSSFRVKSVSTPVMIKKRKKK